MDFKRAKIAYEGYCRQTGWKSLATGQDLPAFDKLSEEIKLAWAAAAWHLWQEFNSDENDEGTAPDRGTRGTLLNSY